MVVLFLAACATALATGLGALPVYWLGPRVDRLRPLLWGTVGGVMAVASIQGLILPGLHGGGDGAVMAGTLVGVAFLLAARSTLSRHEARVGAVTGGNARRAVLVFGVLFVHSLPEGLALGAAWASGQPGLGVFVFLAIALQNVPEGTATAIPLRDSGIGPVKAFWAAVGTSAPQPVGALAAYLLVDATRSLLGASLGFAAGAMLALVVLEVAPIAMAPRSRLQGAAGALAGALGMFMLGSVLHVG